MKTPSHPKKHLSISLFFTLLLPSALSQQCYYPSGNKTDSGYKPCSNDSTDPLSTICCNPDIGDTCLPNGLCAVADTPVHYWRKFCTERDWTGGKCADVCISDDLFVQMTPCDGTNSSEVWCCGGTTACCDSPGLKPVTLARQFGVSATSTATVSRTAGTTSTRASSSKTSVPATSSATFSATAAPSNNNDGLSTGQKAGIGVGVPLGLAVLVGAVLLGVRWHKQRNERLREADVRRTMHAAPMYQEAEMGVGGYR